MSISHQLSLFVDVVRQGSFTKAALLHDMDNSALSKQIKKLEQGLGVQLLNRSTRTISLTSVGEQIYQQAQVLEDTLNNIQRIAETHQLTPSGSIKIAAPNYFGQRYLQPVLDAFIGKYPDVELTLILDDKRADIIADKFDVAIRIGKLADSNLIAKKITNTNFVLIASNDFVAKHGLPQSPEALIALPAVIYANGDVTLDKLTISCEPSSQEMLNLTMKGNFKVNDVKLVVESIKKGVGYGLIDMFGLEESLEEAGLVQLLPDYVISTMSTGIYAIYPNRQRSLLVDDFVSLLLNHLGERPFWLDYVDMN
ncbi:LysR family transcriptional regulator [Vibrio furnissii]|uniref:LysR family transcriptional regulator n=1 Tax=Vibrio furnissii TaxID=29494 RepID=UPI001E572D05|nr:LysR family transcriptional regulator [Vibrio furnissii]UHJ62305.1 LysR substrate-binding domain-containing protein [Vibrio furnissii]